MKAVWWFRLALSVLFAGIGLLTLTIGLTPLNMLLIFGGTVITIVGAVFFATLPGEDGDE